MNGFKQGFAVALGVIVAIVVFHVVMKTLG